MTIYSYGASYLQYLVLSPYLSQYSYAHSHLEIQSVGNLIFADEVGGITHPSQGQ